MKYPRMYLDMRPAGAPAPPPVALYEVVQFWATSTPWPILMGLRLRALLRGKRLVRGPLGWVEQKRG